MKKTNKETKGLEKELEDFNAATGLKATLIQKGVSERGFGNEKRPWMKVDFKTKAGENKGFAYFAKKNLRFDKAAGKSYVFWIE